MQTDRLDTGGDNFSVVRLKRNVMARSNVGLFVSNRQSSTTDFNRVVGADAAISMSRNSDFQGFLARSWTAGRDGNSFAGRAKYNWFTDKYKLFAEHLYIVARLREDIGYVRRTDMGRSNAAEIWQPRRACPASATSCFGASWSTCLTRTAC